MKHSPLSETSKVWRIPQFSNMELLHGTYFRQSFPRHTHERYAIGVVEQGALGYFYRGENLVATPDTICLCIPGEAHTGHPAGSEGWSYRMFYFDATLLRQIASEIADRPYHLPYFQAGVIDDRVVAQQLRRLHYNLETMQAPLLAQETALLEVLARLIGRHADESLPLRRVGHESQAVIQIKHYLENHYANDISLDNLSRLTHLSRYHLLRVFRQAVGVPPHAYLRQVRVRRAKTMLAAGHAIAEVAAATGFTDQSHLTRWFKRLWGFTPGQYRNSVQDNSSAASYPPNK